MQRIIDAYKLRAPMLDENGEAIYNPDGTPLFDDMTDAQKAEAAEEFLAFAAETYGVPIDEIYADNRAEIDKWGREHGRDTHDWNEKRRMTREWMAETGFKPERPGWWKQLISQIRVWLAEHGFGHLREADIETIIQDSFKAANRANRTNRTNGEARYSAEEALKNAFLNEKDADIRQAYPQKTNVEVDAALKDIAGTDLVNRDSNDTAQVNANQARKLVSASAVEKSIKDGTFTRRQHLTAVANIKDLYENAVLIWEGKDEKNEDPNLVVRRFVAPIVFGSDIAGALLTEKMSLNKNNNAKRIYSLELEALFKAEEENLGGHVRLNLPSLSGIERLTHEGFRPDGWNKIERKYEKVKRFLEKNRKKSDGARFSVSPVYTGSAADYDQPSLFYVGTGEGNQVYGWGLYGSESRSVAKWYAENDALDKSTADVLLDGKASDVFLREMRNKNGETTRTAAGCAQHAEEAVNSGDDRVVLPSFSGILDDLAGEIITRLAQAVISADLGIDVVLVVSFPGNGTFRDQRFTSSGDEDLHFGLHGNTEFSGTVFILFVSGIIAEHRIRDADEADIQDAVGLLLGNDLEGVVALESGCDLRARKFGKERFARIVADRADGNRLDLRVHHGPHVIIAAGSAEKNTAESKHTESQDRPEETGIRTLHRNRPFLHRIRGNPFSRLF